jgi:uncharacterized repeat protein (TIGR03803 family)
MSSQGVLTSRIDRLRLLPGISLLIAFAAQAQIGFEPVRSFGFPDGMGDSASGGVIEGSDHNLYGTTVEGGRDGNYGVVYRVQRDGTGYLALHHFSGAPTDGAQSVAALTEGPGGVLYGTTTRGGSNDAGTVFKLNLNGSGYVVLHHFGGGNDGANLQAGILVGSDGMLYGATRAGGLLGSGTLFKLNTDGSGYSAFYSFSGPDDGVDARGTLIEVSNRLYGTTSLGGGSAHGTVFGVNKDGSGFLLLRSFAGAPTDGFDSWAGLLSGTDGALYGTTRQGGSASQGIIFKVNPNGSGYEVLHHFGGAGDGQQPWARLLE